jgi:hypothetical protein
MYDMVYSHTKFSTRSQCGEKVYIKSRMTTWNAVKWIFKYLRGTIDYGIMFSR